MSPLIHAPRGRFRRAVAPSTFLALAFAAHALASSGATLGLREGRWLAVFGATAVTFAGTFAVAALAIVCGLTWQGPGGRFHVSPWTGWLVGGSLAALVVGLMAGSHFGDDLLWAGAAVGGWVSLVFLAWAATRRVRGRRAG